MTPIRVSDNTVQQQLSNLNKDASKHAYLGHRSVQPFSPPINPHFKTDHIFSKKCPQCHKNIHKSLLNAENNHLLVFLDCMKRVCRTCTKACTNGPFLKRDTGQCPTCGVEQPVALINMATGDTISATSAPNPDFQFLSEETNDQSAFEPILFIEDENITESESSFTSELINSRSRKRIRSDDNTPASNKKIRVISAVNSETIENTTPQVALKKETWYSLLKTNYLPKGASVAKELARSYSYGCTLYRYMGVLGIYAGALYYGYDCYKKMFVGQRQEESNGTNSNDVAS